MQSSPDDFERMLREKWQPICTPEEYRQLRRKCGLGDLIEGEIVKDSTHWNECTEAIQHGPEDRDGRCPFCKKRIMGPMPMPKKFNFAGCPRCGEKCTCVEDGVIEE